MRIFCTLALLLCFPIMSFAMQGVQPNGHLPQDPSTAPVLAPQAGVVLNVAPAQNLNNKMPIAVALTVIIGSAIVIIIGAGLLTWGAVDIGDNIEETEDIGLITLGTLFIISSASAIGGSIIYLIYKCR